MTPEDKALSLIESMSFSKSKQMNYANGEMVDIPQNLYAKQCALICCNEVLGYMGADRGYEFWTSVKQEIAKVIEDETQRILKDKL